MKAERLRFEEEKRPSPLKAEPKAIAPIPCKKQRRHSMLEHAKKLTESVNDAFHQETDEADTQKAVSHPGSPCIQVMQNIPESAEEHR